MKLGQYLEPRPVQTISQMLNPQMLTMLNFFNLSYGDLLERIKEEISQNPILEIKKADELISYIKSFQPREKKQTPSEPKSFNLLENTQAASGQTLEEFLISQLNLAQLKPKDYQIGLELISLIDDRGYLNDYFAKRHSITKKLGCSRQKVDAVLKIIQDFEPDGIAARDLAECLLIQIRNYNFEHEDLQKNLEKTITEHLPLVVDKNSSTLAKALSLEEETSRQIIHFIEHNLNPHTANQFGKPDEARPVIPSFGVELKEGTYEITDFENRWGPSLGTNQEYLKILKSNQADEKTVEFIKEKLKKAEDFLKNIERRKNTLRKIIEEICERQKGFFKPGANWLEPFPQKELAQNLNIHPSIISRAIAHKYLQTPKGIFNLKFFCPRNVSGFTPQKIKAKIQSIIRDNVTKESFSDEKICQLLNLAGIKIKRRTVTKYRLEMKLPSSHKK